MMTSVTTMPSPIGDLTLTADGECLTGLYLPGAAFPAATGTSPTSEPLRDAVAQLEEYFAGERQTFTVPLGPVGTPFQLDVWAALRRIGYGTTMTYGAVAAAIGRPAAVRAVGLANGRNPISIIVPCHRVVGADGSLTGYGGGLPAKRALLDLEAGARGLLTPALAETS